MRVISGTARGRKLLEPSGAAIRPTSDMVKEAFFNIIQFDIEGRRVLDLFAGTGQLGIEALSRGAASVVFVDDSAAALQLIRSNLGLCGMEGTVVLRDAMRYIERCEEFDLIFIDPPYDSKLAERALEKIYEFDILANGGIIVCEVSNEKVMPELDSPYYMRREYRYGKKKLVVYGKGRGEVEDSDYSG